MSSLITNQTRIWHELWLFGIVVDDDLELESLKGFYVDPNWPDERRAGYYVPDDKLSTIVLDGPSRVDNPALDEMAELFRVAS